MDTRQLSDCIIENRLRRLLRIRQFLPDWLAPISVIDTDRRTRIPVGVDTVMTIIHNLE